MEAGDCAPSNPTSTAEITLSAVTKRTCKLRCKAGFYQAEGDAIAFTCNANADKKNAEGTPTSLTKCNGA